VTLTGQTIKDFAVGDDFDVIRLVTDVPAGVTIAKAWFMVKARLNDTDGSAVITKEITTSAVEGTGQIADDGDSDGAGELVFQLRTAETEDLVASKRYHYGIKVLLSNGLKDTLGTGELVLGPQLIQDAS
jgi:hypothetical protein